MDREQVEMQALDLSGIYKEACKVIFSCRKIFSQISITLILPLSIVFLAHVQVTDILSDKIDHNENALEKSVDGTPGYKKISHLLTSEWSMLLLIKAIYFTFLFILSLLSTAAVVYTIACIYTARVISFKKVMSVVPKVWKRLMVTFLCIFLAMLVYNMIFCLVALLILSIFIGESKIGHVILVILAILFIIGFAYMSLIWNLASVASVLEDVYGVQAMVKGKNLIKGQMGKAIFIYYVMHSSLVIIQFGFESLVVDGGSLGMVGRLGFGILCLLLHSLTILFGLVIQTVFYFFCKSYHHESIDKAILSDHLEVYLLGESAPLLKAKEIQLQNFNV